MDRIRYLDSLRALATVAVVAIHVAGNNWYGYVGSSDWMVFTVYAGICKFCVPIFFMISGALFLNPGRKCDLKRLYAHNILRLVLFLIVWSIIYLLFHLLESGEDVTPASLAGCVKSILKGDTQTHFWFVYALIGIYVVSPIIKVFTDNAGKRMIQYYLILWLVIQSVFDAVSEVPLIAPVFNNIAKMQIQVTMSYLGFFVLGHYLATYDLGSRARKLVYALGACGLTTSIILTMYLSIVNGIPDETCFGYFFPGLVLYSAAVFVFFRQRGKKESLERDGGISRKGEVVISAVSRYSLGIYGVHMLFIFLLWNIGITTFSFCSVLSVPAITFVVLMVSLCVSWILSKVPIINKFMV